MDFFKATEISAAGMAVQKARVEAAALNLANMNTSSAPGTMGYRPVTALIRQQVNSFANAMNGNSGYLAPKVEIVPEAGLTPRMSYEPGHPHADASGMVSYPSVDHTHEMMTVMTALRSYEANLTALQATKMLATRALEIGSS